MDKNNIYKTTYEVINENYFEWGEQKTKMILQCL